MRFLHFVLEGPLQSWGEKSRWDKFRDSAASPTKSGVIGLLGCCLGIDRCSPEMTHLCNALHMAVRIDKPGMFMVDFHTIVPHDGRRLPTANGKFREKDKSTIVTKRQYLQDAKFTVLLWGDSTILEDCYEALSHPKWVPYLGRRCCVPATPIIPNWIEAKRIDEAIIADAPNNNLIAEIECMPDDILREDERIITRPDNIVNSSTYNFMYRKIRVSTIRGGE